MILSPEEKSALHAAYNADAYPAPTAIDKIAKELNLPESTVINWFHNHRSRLKRQPIFPLSGQSEVNSSSAVYIMSGSGEDQPQVITIQNEGPSTSSVHSDDQMLENGSHNGDIPETENSKALDALREAVDLATRGANADLATSNDELGDKHEDSMMETDHELSSSGQQKDSVDDLGDASSLSSREMNHSKDKSSKDLRSSPVLGGAEESICCGDDEDVESLSQNPYEDIIKLKSGTEEYDSYPVNAQESVTSSLV